MTADREVFVVGAGPTGLTLACLLHERGVHCRVIDQAPEPTGLSRAIGLSTRSLEIFDEIGVVEDAIETGHRLAAVSFHARGRRIGRVSTSVPSGTRHPYMLALPQFVTERMLQRRLEELGGHVERGVRLADLARDPGAGGVSLTLESPDGAEHAEAAWVVGADGAHSIVRKRSGIAFAGKATDVVFVIVDAHLEGGPARGEAHYYFSPEGLLVTVPLADGTYRLAATMSARAPRAPEVDVPFVQRLLEARVADRSLRVTELRNAGWGAAQVQIHARVAETFRADRCILAGDAAHIYSPVGGQGMNSGIGDAHNLAWKLALVASGRASATLLDSYDAERRDRAHRVLRENAGQTRMAAMSSRLGAALQRVLASQLSKPGAINRRFVTGLAQLDADYSGSPGVVGGGRRGPTGQRVPDVNLASAAGARSLHELIREATFTLLVLSPGDGDLARVDELEGRLRERAGDLVSVHTVARGRDSSAAAFVDRDGELHDQLRVKEPALCLVRPDAHVAYTGALDGQRSLLDWLDGVLEREPSRSQVGV